MIALFSRLRAVVHPSGRIATLLGLLSLVMLGFPGDTAPQLHLAPHPDSRFWIQGDATVRNFTCVVNRIEGSARLPAAQDSVPTETDEEDMKVVVRVPIEAIDCGNSRMTSDLQETLKMETHPNIRFELVHATMKGRTDTSGQWRHVEVLGPLTIAGTKRLKRLQASVRALDEQHFRIRGCLPIRMTYFRIDPPSTAFGLIKVKNRVEVQFDLLAQTTDADGPNPLDTLSLTTPPSCHE
jgi:polyisoprenoid-binding protein YceI